MQTLAGDLFHKCATSKTHTRHTEFAKVPCDNATQHCTAKFPASKFSPLQITGSRTSPNRVQHHATQQFTRPEPPSLYDGTSPLHSKQQFTQSFQLVFQFLVHTHSSRRCVNSKRTIALICSNRNVKSAQHQRFKHTNWSTITQPRFPTQRSFTYQVACLLRDKRVALPVQHTNT